jgi:hypothetical protein
VAEREPLEVLVHLHRRASWSAWRVFAIRCRAETMHADFAETRDRERRRRERLRRHTDRGTIRGMPSRRRPGSRGTTLGYRDAFASFVADFPVEAWKDGARAALDILRLSSFFKKILNQLNKAYVSSAALEKRGGIEAFNPDEDGILTTGPFSKRRTLTFTFLTEGNRFASAGSFPVRGTAFQNSDFIFLSFPLADIVSEQQRGALIARLIGSIAHETVHAFHRVTAPPSPRVRLPRKKRAADFITEEIDTRDGERTILEKILSLKKRRRPALEIAEASARSTGVRASLDDRLTTMKRSRAGVERDTVSGSVFTYLETFVFEDLLETSIRDQALDSQQLRDTIALVDRLELKEPLETVLLSADQGAKTVDPTRGLPPVLSQTAELLLMRRLVEMNWRQAGDLAPDTREAVLQLHAKAGFPEDIQYTPLP